MLALGGRLELCRRRLARHLDHLHVLAKIVDGTALVLAERAAGEGGDEEGVPVGHLRPVPVAAVRDDVGVLKK